MTHGISVIVMAFLLGIILLLWVAGFQFPTAPKFYDRMAAIVRAQLAEEAPAQASVDGEALAAQGPRKERPSGVPHWRELKRVGETCVLGGALSAVVLLPLYAHRNLRGVSSAFSDPFIWGEVARDMAR